MDTKLLDRVKAEAITTRRDIHRHAELGLTEFRTASLVAQRLKALGLELQLGREVMDSGARVGLPSAEEIARCYSRARAEGADPGLLAAFEGGHTAVVGLLKGARPGPVVALRVDMDALPILEASGADHVPAREGFASVHQGVMHACGHDCHTAIGLAVGEMLAAERERLHGTVKLIFQPGEEGGRGALPMMKAGVVEDVDYFIAIHIGTGVPSHVLRPRVYGHLASAKLDVTFHGRAAHAGGRPEEGRNALLGAAQAVTALYGISRHNSGRSRINVGVLQAGSGRNVIADLATMAMEVRGESEEIVEYMLKRAEAVIRGAATAQELEVEIDLVGRTTTADSDERLAAAVARACDGLSGLKVVVAPHRTGGSEDATYFMRRVQEKGGLAIYMAVGSDLPSGHHTPRFDVDETDIAGAIEPLARAILRLGEEGAAVPDAAP